MKPLKFTLLFTLLSFVALSRDNQAYIQQYKDIAIREMQLYKIPASITLAQGILESAAGTSYLATKGNNHFGIKCHSDWKGKSLRRDDDKKNECFRRYKHAEESFRDHSLFLAERSRYAFLFDLDPTDYKGWAKGLKKAGYATNKKYPTLLIDLIERYQLYQYDTQQPASGGSRLIALHPNNIKYITVQEGETLEGICAQMELKVDKVLENNDLSYDDEIQAGQVLFLKKKKKKGNVKYYTVKQGDTMYSISQRFGIQLDDLYKKNLMKVGEQPRVGQQMWLRKTKGKKFLGLF